MTLGIRRAMEPRSRGQAREIAVEPLDLARRRQRIDLQQESRIGIVALMQILVGSNPEGHRIGSRQSALELDDMNAIRRISPEGIGNTLVWSQRPRPLTKTGAGKQPAPEAKPLKGQRPN